MNIKGIIWCASGHLEKGCNKLNEITKNYELMGVKLTTEKRSPCNYRVFDNGDTWRVASACESSRGVRGNIHYIDRSINMVVLETIIRPTMTAVPFSSYQFYGEGDLYIADGKIDKPTFKYEINIDEYANRPFKGK